MARHQEFNTREAVGKAMNVFWEKGYKAASLNDLLNEMGIGKGSFYATFGSKRELFLDALRNYGEKQSMVSRVTSILTSRPAKTTIAEIFERVIDRVIDDKRCCLFGKTAIEFWRSDPEIANEVEEGVKHVEKAFHQVVLLGQKDGEIPSDRDPLELAHFLTGIFYGLQIMGSAIPDRKALNNVVANALSALD